MQQRRKANPPPLSSSDNEIVAGGALSDQRADIEVAVPRNVDGQTALQSEDQEQTENQANGEKRDISQKPVIAQKCFLAGQRPRGIMHDLPNGRRGDGLK